MKIIYERNYVQLVKLIPNLWALPECYDATSHAEKTEDLNLYVLLKRQNKIIIALSHFIVINGCSMPEPHMVIKASRQRPQHNRQANQVEALRFNNSRWQSTTVYKDRCQYSPSAKKMLNDFLENWLQNCLEQGHRFSTSDALRREE